MILDTAGAKGTGKWMSQFALDLGVPSTLVTEAVYARCLSALKDDRVRASKVLHGPAGQVRRRSRKQFIEAVRHALYASKICSYAQGFVQLQAAAERTQLAAELRQHRPAVARRLHHPRAFPRPDQRSVRRRSEARKPAARSLLPRGAGQRAGRLAARGGNGRASWASRRPPSRPPCPTTTATAATACRPTCCRPSAITSAPTRTSAIDKPGTFHTDWLRAAAATEMISYRLRIIKTSTLNPSCAAKSFLENMFWPRRPGRRRHRRHRRAGRRAGRRPRPGRRDDGRRRPQRRARPNARRSDRETRRQGVTFCRSTSRQRKSIEELAGRRAETARPRRHARQLRRREFGDPLLRSHRRRLAPRHSIEPDQHSLGLPDFRHAHDQSRRRLDSEHRQRHSSACRCRACSPTRRRRRRWST